MGEILSRAMNDEEIDEEEDLAIDVEAEMPEAENFDFYFEEEELAAEDDANPHKGRDCSFLGWFLNLDESSSSYSPSPKKPRNDFASATFEMKKSALTFYRSAQKGFRSLESMNSKHRFIKTNDDLRNLRRYE